MAKVFVVETRYADAPTKVQIYTIPATDPNGRAVLQGTALASKGITIIAHGAYDTYKEAVAVRDAVLAQMKKAG